MNRPDPEIQPLSKAALDFQAAFDQIQDQINAGFVFVAAADQYLNTDPAREMMCRGEGEDCFAMAVESLGRSGLSDDQRNDLEAALKDLREQLDRLKSAGPTASYAA